MNSLSYVEAWAHWFRGETVSTYLLWHVQILWWGRIGKIVSLLSALTVIAEIIGAPRLKEFGKSLHGRFTFQKALATVKNSFGALRLLVRYFRADKSEEDEILEEFLFRTPVGWLTMIFGWGGAISTFVVVYRTKGFWSGVGYSVSVLLLAYLVVPPIAALLLSLPMLILLILDLLVIEPLAWILEREPIDRLIKAGSLALLLIGFHFDLLAS